MQHDLDRRVPCQKRTVSAAEERLRGVLGEIVEHSSFVPGQWLKARVLGPARDPVAQAREPEHSLGFGVVVGEVGEGDRPAAVSDPRTLAEVDLVKPHALAAPELGRAAQQSRPPVEEAVERPAGDDSLVEVGPRVGSRGLRDVAARLEQYDALSQVGRKPLSIEATLRPTPVVSWPAWQR
jgi:hypothetical protein